MCDIEEELEKVMDTFNRCDNTQARMLVLLTELMSDLKVIKHIMIEVNE